MSHRGYVNDRSKVVIKELTKKKINLYSKHIFKVTTLIMGPGFDPTWDKIDDLKVPTLNTTSDKEHVPERELTIKVLKERTRDLMKSLTYKLLPRRMAIEMVNLIVLWINAFPDNRGVSDRIGSRGMITGTTLDFRRHYKVDFGAYFQTHK